MRKTEIQTGARIFISHSWEDPDTRELCTHLPPRLEQKGYGVLIDQRKINAGEMWRPKINGWLCECEGAVVLISPPTLISSWVLYEYSILAWQKLSCDMQMWVSNIARCLRQASSWQIEETLLHIFGVQEPTARLFAQLESAFKTDLRPPQACYNDDKT